MGTWQSLVILSILDYSKRRAERLQSIHRCTITSRCERQQFSTLIVVHLVKNDLPQPFDSGILRTESASIVRVVTKLLEVEFTLSTDQFLNLMVVEQALNYGHVDDTGEAFLEGSKLSLTLLLELELDVESNELLYIVQSDHYVGSAFLQLMLSGCSELD